MDRTCFWYGTVAEMAAAEPEAVMAALQQQHQHICHQFPSGEQLKAWKNCLPVLKDVATRLPADWHMIMEFVLPRERGRRPDVIVLNDAAVYVLEFKDSRRLGKAYVDQVDAYARDLAEYHAGSRGKRVVPVLVMAQMQGLKLTDGEVHIYSPDTLLDDLDNLMVMGDAPGDVLAFLQGEYAPLPSLVEAAKLLFEKQPLPQIRRAESAGIPQALEALHKQATASLTTGQKTLALVTGVPGAGKTLVGLQFSYDHSDNGSRRAVYLSGNGPLVKVLQLALGKGSQAFVQDVHGFLQTYGAGSTRIPEERIWIFDEAQRAWDEEKAQGKRGNAAVSEPMDFLALGSRVPGGAMMIGLIGEGQEIHLGEESGIRQWNDAIAQSSHPWTVICPAHIASIFTSAARCEVVEALNLNTSLRTHRASLVQRWVSALLNNDIDEAAELARVMTKDQYPLYITRNIDSAKTYVRERYKEAADKRYGLLASSKANNLSPYGIHNDYQSTKRVKEGPWFADAQESPLSCCQLLTVTTEFSCQGLELDLPIVGWGNDLLWTGSQWASRPSPRSKAKNPHQLRLNSYRVLLTRGRDGLMIFVPPEKSMDGTFEVLCKSGCSLLKKFGADE